MDEQNALGPQLSAISPQLEGIDSECKNTDTELWRQRQPGAATGMEYYQPSIHVTASGGIGINVGGLVFVKSLAEWHKLAHDAAPHSFSFESMEPT